MNAPDIDYLRDLFAPLGTIRARRMFGGYGLYCDERFFALIAEQRLYLKVDALSEADFRQAGCEPFVYLGKGKPVALSYWSVPDEAMDDADAMLPWARRALGAAQRAAAAKVGKARPAGKKSAMTSTGKQRR